MIRTLLNVVCLLCVSGAGRSIDGANVVRLHKVAELRSVLAEISPGRATAERPHGLPERLREAIEAWT